MILLYHDKEKEGIKYQIIWSNGNMYIYLHQIIRSILEYFSP